MSATPEQIAERLEARSAYWNRHGSHDPEYLGYFGANDAAMLNEAASLIRAQSEREKVLVEALGDARAKALEEAAVIAETWFDHHRPKQPEKSRFDIYDIEHWAKSATRLVAEDIRARAALAGAR